MNWQMDVWVDSRRMDIGGGKAGVWRTVYKYFQEGHNIEAKIGDDPL